MSNKPRNRREARRATPLGEWAAATDEDLGRLIASELAGVVEQPRLLTRVGLWITFVAQEAGDGARVLVSVRPRATVSDEVAEQVLRAAAAGRTRQHPSVLPAHRYGCSERLLWISLPEARGSLLRQWYSDERVPSPASALEFLRHAAAPLVALHAKGLVHGALTVSAFHRDSSGVVRVCCPGVDLALLRGDLAAGVESEAAAFAAPEVRAGQEPDAAADQYGLAAILVKLISGDVVTPGEGLPPEVPLRWAPSLLRALDRDPRGRWSSVRELVETIDSGAFGVGDARGKSAAGAGATYQPSAFRRRRGGGRRLEGGAATPPGVPDVQVLFPPPEGEEEVEPAGPAPAERGGWGRRVAGVALVLLLGGVAGVVYAGGSPQVVPEVLAAALDDWLDNWYAWAPIGERLGRAPSAEAGAAPHGLQETTDAAEEALPADADRPSDAGRGGAADPSLAPPAASDGADPEPSADFPEPAAARAGQVAVEAPPTDPQPLSGGGSPAPTPERAPEAPAVAPPSASSPPPSSFPSSQPATDALAPGRLSLQSYPWGAVYIDGVFMGNTPLLDVRLPAGDHQIRIERPPYDPFSVIVTVEPGQTLRLTGIVLTGGDR